MDHVLDRYFDFRYFLRFIAFFFLLYFFNFFFLGITCPQSYYSPFLDHHLNYIKGLTSSVLYCSNIIVHAFGLNSFVNGKLIKVVHGASVLLKMPCLGLGIMSFWIAFIFAHKSNYLIKIKWCIIGLVSIWLINCFRIALLLLALQNKWNVNKHINHHDLFKYCAYVAIVFMIYLFNRIDNKAIYVKNISSPALNLPEPR